MAHHDRVLSGHAAVRQGQQGQHAPGDPARAGEAMNRIAVKLLDGQTVKAGDDLGVSGYNAVELDGNVIYGQAWVDVTKDNAKDYPF